MLFDLISDRHTIDLVDEQGKLFKRFFTETQYKEWAQQFSPEDLKGLVRKDTVVKWYDNNWEVAKLVMLVMGVGYIIYTVITGL